MVMALGLPAIERVTYQKMNSTTRKMVGLVRTIRNDAILLNSIYRLAVDFEHKTYWIEVQKTPMLIPQTQEVRQKKQDKKGDPPPSNFVIADKYSKEPIPMPAGVVFEGLLKERDGLAQQGVAYVHFFPNGFNEQAILYIAKDGSPGKGYSLWIKPTAGRVEIYRSYIKDFES